MKRTMFFVVLLITSVFVACNNDTTKPANELAGEWNLVSISCECPPVTLNSGESIWAFDTANDQLNVRNNVALQANMLQSGNYEVVVDEENSTMSDIWNIMCNYQFEDDGNTLIIGCMEESDGPRFTLTK